MSFRPGVSTWDLLGIAFWPAAGYVLWLRPRERIYALWAVGAYLLIALPPISSAKCSFGARQVMTTCVPFALCLAWVMRRGLSRVLGPVWLRRCWPVLLVAVVLCAYATPRAILGNRTPHTGNLGKAIQQIIASTEWNEDSDILVHPSLYMRYRLLFPEHLRRRLRVVVDDRSPDWWRHTTIDIVARRTSLSSPRHAYLLATPAQLRAEPELWDYGVTLPLDTLDAWNALPLRGEVALLGDRTIGPVEGSRGDVRLVLVVLVGDVS